jgi:hypothetical protein
VILLVDKNVMDCRNKNIGVLKLWFGKKNAQKKKVPKKAPIEQFFYKKFFEISFWTTPDLVLFQISKNFYEKNCSMGAFFGTFFSKLFFLKMAKSVFVTSYRVKSK